MNHYLQTDPRWANLKYDGENTFARYGCFVTSLAMIADKLPTEVAKILKDNDLFTNGYINDSTKAASLLGLIYDGKSTSKPDYDCICETLYYGGQHFFVLLKDGTQLDPLGKSIKYPIKTYRLFRKEENVNCKLDDEKALHMRRNIVFRLRNVILGREGDPTEQTVQEDADWIDRDSGDSFNYQGVANYLIGLWNSDEAKAYRQSLSNETLGKLKEECQKALADKDKSLDEMEALKDGQIETLTLENKRLKDEINSKSTTLAEEIIKIIKKIIGKEKNET
jgi:hypothetical protein